MKYKNILFDLDGTIIKSESGVIKGLKLSLAYLGIEVKDEALLLKFLGPPLYDSYKKYFNLNDDEYVKALEVFRKYYLEKGIFDCTLYDGIQECLESLYQSGLKLFIATSKPETEARRIIEHFQLEKFFEFIGGADCDHNGERTTKTAVIEYVIDRAKITNRDSILMVGDRFHDIVGAKNANIASMSVLYGYGSEEEFLRYNTNYIVKSTNDIVDFIINK